MSWITIKNAFISFAASHGQINSIGFGDPLSIGTDNVINLRTPERERIIFPLLFVDIQGATLGQGTNTLQVNILTMNKTEDVSALKRPALPVSGALINRWKDTEDEVLNDMLLIFMDVVAHFTDNPDVEYAISNTINLTRFVEGRDDRVAGWQGTINFIMPYGRNVCQIPTL